MSTEPTFQELLAEFSDEIFVGRTAQLALFEQVFTAARSPFLILAISGQGGVGKTTLLEQFGQVAERYKARHVLVNEDHKSVLEALANFGEQLGRAGYPCKNFDERYHKYRELKEQVEADPKAPKGFLDFAVRSATRIGIRTLRRVPLAGDVAEVLLSPEAEEQIVEESSAFAAYVAQKFTNKDERLLLVESEKELTSHFLTDINKLAADRRVILCFDTYEQTAPYLDAWLRDLIAGKFGVFSSRVTLVIAGRYPLGQSWTGFRRAIRQVELDPFSQEEAREYLERSGITDEEQVAHFIKLSDCLPVLLAMLTFAPGEAPSDLSANAVERFLQGMRAAEREIALRSAAPRHFNRDILAAVLVPEQVDYAFTWLSEAHFVRPSEDGWRYHEVVRTLLLRYFRLRSNTQYTEVHEQMAAYYAAQLVQLHLAEEQQRMNHRWRYLETERLYHIVAAQPVRNLVELINALLLNTLADLEEGVTEAGIRKSIKQTAQIILQIYREAGDQALALWAQQVERLITTEDDLVEFSRAIKPLFPVLLSLPSILDLSKHTIWLLAAALYQESEVWEDAAKAATEAIKICATRPYAYRVRAYGYRGLKRYGDAISDYSTAIALNPKEYRHYFWRGRTSLDMEEYAAALADFSKTIELQPQYEYSYHWRGITYGEMKEYQAALADFNKAIEIQPNRQSYYRRARVYCAMANYIAALADFNKAIELQPDNIYSYSWRGYVYYHLGDYAAALADFTQAIGINAEDGANYYWCGRAHHAAGDYAAAITAFTKASELQPNDDYSYHWRGRTHSALREYAAAMTDFHRAIELDAGNSYARHWRGLLHYYTQEYEAAVADFTQAAAADAPALGHFWCAVVCLRLGEGEEAEAALAQVEEVVQSRLPEAPPAVVQKALARLAKIAAGQAQLNEKWLDTVLGYLPTDPKFKREISWLTGYLADLPAGEDALVLRRRLQYFLEKWK